MTYRYSRSSQDKLATCDQQLITLFSFVIKFRDCTIAWGHRNQQEQNRIYIQGASKVKWPHSDHNKLPSRAVDAYPYIDGAVSFDRDQCINFAGFVQGLAAFMDIPLGWGGDWDQDFNIKEHKLQDLGHFYLL